MDLEKKKAALDKLEMLKPKMKDAAKWIKNIEKVQIVAIKEAKFAGANMKDIAKAAGITAAKAGTLARK